MAATPAHEDFDDSEEGREMKRIFEIQCKRFPNIPKVYFDAIYDFKG